MLAVILVYQQVENYMIQPAVMSQAVELSGFATIAVVMLGGALLGVVGAILAVPVAASVKSSCASSPPARRAEGWRRWRRRQPGLVRRAGAASRAARSSSRRSRSLRLARTAASARASSKAAAIGAPMHAISEQRQRGGGRR